MLLEFPVEGHPGAMKLSARLALVPVCRPKGRQEPLSLVAGQPGFGMSRLPQLLFHFEPGYPSGRTVDEERLEQVPELAHIARPVVTLETFESFLREPLDSLAELSIQAENEMVNQIGHVLVVLAQSRDRDPEYVEPIEQVPPEPPSLDHLLEPAVRRGNDPDVERNDHPSSEPDDTSTFQRIENFGLGDIAHVSDLVEQDGAALGQLQLARIAGHGARESAPLMPEQLALEQRVGEGRAVDDAERSSLP